MGLSLGGSADGEKRRRGSTVEQYEKEIQRLQTSMDCMRRKLEDFELRDSNNDLASNSSTHSDSKMRSIISRYIFILNSIPSSREIMPMYPFAG